MTKLDVVSYYLAVEDGIMRALARRPTTLERWPEGVHPGIVLSTRERARRRRVLPEAGPEGRARTTSRRRGSSSPRAAHADEICPTEIAVVGWAAQMGTITFHPWPVREDDVDHPGRAAHRPRSAARHGLRGRRARRRARRACCSDELGYIGFPKTSGGRGIHIYVRIEPRWTFTDVRHAAIAFGRELERRLPGEVTTAWWKEQRGERIFVDYNQNARDRTIASAYSVRPKPGAPVSAPLAWDELPEVAPEDFTVATMPARFAEVGGPARRDRRRGLLAAAAARPVRARRDRGPRRHALPAGLPEDAGRAQARAALARPRPPARLTATRPATPAAAAWRRAS